MAPHRTTPHPTPRKDIPPHCTACLCLCVQWEAIYYGSIPVVEHSTFDRTFVGLPVLLVDSYKQVTPTFLDKEWEEMSCNPSQYDFKRLTVGYWKGLIQTVVKDQTNEIIQQKHPIPAKYSGCWDVRTDWDVYNLAKG